MKYIIIPLAIAVVIYWHYYAIKEMRNFWIHYDELNDVEISSPTGSLVVIYLLGIVISLIAGIIDFTVKYW